MAKSILSFEEYSSNIKKSKSTAEGNAFGAARAKAIADGEEEFEVDGEKVPVKGVDKEDKENAEEFVEETEDVEDESDDDDSDDDDSEDDDDEDDDEDDEETEKVEEILETCSDHLSKSYEMAIKEAIEYDGDDYPDHTLESYMKENASLVASLSAQSCEDCYSEIKDEDLTKEMYEAILNEMKESYVKKIEEMKESWVG